MAPDRYLRSVLADGARPFRHRTGVRELLGEPPDTSLRVRFTPATPRAGFSYLSRDGSADVPVGAPHWLAFAADDQVEAPEAVARAPVRPRPVPPDSAPPDSAPVVDPPAGTAESSRAPTVGPAPCATVVIPGTTTPAARPGSPPARAGLHVTRTVRSGATATAGPVRRYARGRRTGTGPRSGAVPSRRYRGAGTASAGTRPTASRWP